MKGRVGPIAPTAIYKPPKNKNYMNWEGHRRVSIDNVSPEIDCGYYTIKRFVN